MKLCLMSVGCALLGLATLVVCGCSGSATCPANSAAQQASLDERTATTQLMSAQLTSPASKDGKSQLVGTAVDERGAENAATMTDEISAPKEPRRSDGSRRGGRFGASK